MKKWTGVLFAALFPVLVTWLYFDVFPGSTVTTALYSANKIVQIVFPVLWLGLILKAPIRREMRLATRVERRGIVAGAAFGLAVAAGMLGLYVLYFKQSEWLAGVPATVFAKMGELGIASPLKFTVFGLFLILINSAMEEYYWRWFLFGQLRGLVPAWVAIVSSSAAFSLHHAVALGSFIHTEHSGAVVLLFSAGIGVGGAVWAWIYHRTGSLLGAWLSHLLCDIPIILIGLDLLRGQWGA